MKSKIDSMFCVLDKIMEALSALILGSMTLFIFAQVVARYVLKMPLAWSEEGARFLFIWMTFIAGYVGSRKGQHIGVELIQNMFPLPVKKGMQVFSDLITSGFFMVVFYYCCTQWGKFSAQISPALKLPMSAVYFGMMLGCFCMALNYFFDIFKVLGVKEENV